MKIIKQRERKSVTYQELRFFNSDGECVAGYPYVAGEGVIPTKETNDCCGIFRDMFPKKCQTTEKECEWWPYYLKYKNNDNYTSEVVTETYSYTEPAEGRCSCGNIVHLTAQHLGACQCSKCGTWYNLFGQQLVAPEYWED